VRQETAERGLCRVDRDLISLKLTNLGHEFENRVVFSGLNLDFAGPSLAVTGPNGSGKTTLLKVLAGLLSPTSGLAEVLIDGSALTRNCLRSAAGLAGPDIHLYPELTPRENLRFLGRARGLTEAESRVAAVLERVGLDARADDPTGELSSGLRQRACLAAALLHGPSILLLDEPSTNMDEQGIETVRAIIGDQAQSGMVVLATNDPREASLAAERVELG
jgi:heme exporter protein A